MKVLIFGAGGLLGTVLCQYVQKAGHDVVRFARSSSYDCSTEDEMAKAFTDAFRRAAPDYVVNLVAATNVDQCEEDYRQAALLNCFAPQVLSRLCSGKSHLVHISSDQVYDGTGPHPEVGARPINVYALTKLVGEYPVLESGGCVLRTNFFGKSQSPARSSFSDWLVNAGQNRQLLNVFSDVWFNPLGMNSLSAAILRALDQRLSGLYNVGSATSMSKADFAKTLFENLGLDSGLLRRVCISNAQLKARRPHDMRMDCTRFVTATGLVLPTIEEEIKHEAANYL